MGGPQDRSPGSAEYLRTKTPSTGGATTPEPPEMREKIRELESDPERKRESRVRQTLA